ncbi:MAG: Holliday junction resolvase RuvX [Rhodanobacter sp.]
MSCVLGFDVGSRLTGVAIGNRFTATARALGTVTVNDAGPDWTRLDALHQQWLPETLVVGLPLTLEGAEQPASQRARAFAAHLKQRYNLPVVFVDERHSSQEAAQRFAAGRAAGLRRRRDAAVIDAEAAAVILERWLVEATTSPTEESPN